MNNILYFHHLNEIGGVETMFYYLAKKYRDHDITVYYRTGDLRQIQRLSELVRVRQYRDGDIITCKKAFFNFVTDIIDNVRADEYIQIIHTDFKGLGQSLGYRPNTHPKINRYVGVSKLACESFTELTGIDCELCYNPIDVDKPKKVLNLVSATRLTPEKGRNRMIKLGHLLDEAKIPYLWTIFTNDTNAIDNPNIVYMRPRLDVINFIANADYLVQLSDTEAYSYSLIESLSVGTPLIVTDLPVLKEMHVENGVNAFIVDFDMKNVPIDDIYRGLPKFKYKANADRWGELLAPGESDYTAEMMTIVKVKPKIVYHDLEKDKLVYPTDPPFETSKPRAEMLVKKGYVSIVDTEN